MSIYFTIRFKVSFQGDTDRLTVLEQHRVAIDAATRIEQSIKEGLPPYEDHPEIVKVSVDGYEEKN